MHRIVERIDRRARGLAARLPAGARRPAVALALTVALLALPAVAMACRGAGEGGRYSDLLAELPATDDLAARATSFRSTRIFDRDGRLLNETFDPDAGRRTVVGLDEIAPALAEATIATEDANFYRHSGVDPLAIARAVYYAVREREVVSGASTIPQQLVKRLYLTPERSMRRKIREAFLAGEISRRYSKDEILTLYLNEIYYGNLANGVHAAAETYFDKRPSELSLPEAALVAGLPQAPAFYDPYANPDRAKARQEVVLDLMAEEGYISREEAAVAKATPLEYAPLRLRLDAPHFVLTVREQVEALLGPDALYTLGLRVTTTLDWQLQQDAERIVVEQLTGLVERNVTNAAVVVLRPASGEVLALVGSADFHDEAISGQVNMALAPRQPGSAMKPLAYLAALEGAGGRGGERFTAETLLADVETAFPDGANAPYVPVNYDEREHGMVTARAALANSYNIPAVRVMERIGVAGLVEISERLGITTLTRPDYGLSLVLGAGEVPLLELTGAYATLANAGVGRRPVTIRRIESATGEVVCELGTDRPCVAGAEGVRRDDRVVDPRDAFLITDMLSDNAARADAFGPSSALDLGRPAAAKTGTTNDFRDNLTVGYAPGVAVGVWVGNADNTPMEGVSGVTGAGPIWNGVMRAAIGDAPPAAFPVPDGISSWEVCADTGTRPSEACPATRQAWFRDDAPPLPSERDLWQRLRIDREAGRLASEYTPEVDVEEVDFKVYPDEHRQWAIDHGIPQPPSEVSDRDVVPADVRITSPTDRDVVSGVVTVRGSAVTPGFVSYVLQYGRGDQPAVYDAQFGGRVGEVVDGGVLGAWDASALPAGRYTLRLVARDRLGRTYEHTVRVDVVPPTATPSPTITPTALPTDVPTVTATPLPTEPPAPPTLAARPTVPLPPPPLPTDPPPTETPAPPTPVPTEPPSLPPGVIPSPTAMRLP